MDILEKAFTAAKNNPEVKGINLRFYKQKNYKEKTEVTVCALNVIMFDKKREWKYIQAEKKDLEKWRQAVDIELDRLLIKEEKKLEDLL